MNNKAAYIWGLASRFIPQILYLTTTIVLARFVTPQDFGKIGVLAVIFTVANILIDSGLGGSLIKEKETTDIDCSTISLFNIFVGCVIYITLFCASHYIEHFFNVEGLSPIIRVIGIVFPITALGVVPVSLLKRNLQFNCIFKSSLISVIAASIVSIILAVKGFGVYSLVTYQIVVNLVMVLLNYVYSKYRFSFVFSYASLTKLLPFGFYTSIVTIVDTIYENLMTMLTGKCLNVQTAGYIYQAKRLEETMSSSFAVAIGIVAFPVLTKLKEDRNVFIAESIKTFKATTLLIFPLLLSVSLLSPYIIQILFGKQWIESAFYLRILMFAGMFIIMEQLILSFIKAWGNVKSLMYWTLVKRGIGICALLVTIMIDPECLIYTYLLTTVIGLVINYILFMYLLKLPDGKFLRCIFDSIIPSILYYVIGILIISNISSIYLSLMIIIVLLCFYYLPYLRHHGIDVITMVKNIINLH